MWKLFTSFKYFDIPLSLSCGLLVLVGLVAVYGSSLSNPTLSLFYRQLVFAALGILCYVFCSFYNYHKLAKANRLLYIAIVLVLLGVLLFGPNIRGSSRWIDLGFFRFQPAEPAKIVILLGLSRWLYLRRGEINSWKNIALTFLFTAIPVGLVMLGPDLGSSIILLSIWGGILSMSWVNKKYLAGIVVVFLLFTGFAWKFLLHDFQRHRIEIFLNPSLDPQGRGYNVRQATIAVGSGQLFGRGLGRGLQSQLKFLPERQTDFIFAGLAEEIGFIGSVIILTLYGIVFVRLWRIASLARDELGAYIVGGVLFMMLSQTAINIGMNLGLLPVTGIPLPLISYGGSSLVVVLTCLGIVQNVARQSRALRF